MRAKRDTLPVLPCQLLPCNCGRGRAHLVIDHKEFCGGNPSEIQGTLQNLQ